MSKTQFLDLMESYTAADASPSALYGDVGTSVSARRAKLAENQQYNQKLLEAAKLYAKVLNGDRFASFQFQEAMSTSDFPNLFGDILDRQILAAYRQQPVAWEMVAKRGRTRDFRTVKRFTLDGGEAILTKVKQLAEYPAAALTDGAYSYAVEKYGRTLPLAWEDFINDDLDTLRDTPNRLGNGARRSEEYFATDLYAGTTGPDGTYFASGNSNIVTSNPVLSISALQTAFAKLAAQVDTDGAPIYIEGAVLVVPPALQVVAENILHATEILSAAGGGDGTGNDQVRTANWMRNRVRLQVNPWLPIISTTNGSTSWYLFADPNVGRPAMEVGFLIGHEVPELFVKSPNAMRVGGGQVSPEDGDFETDGVNYKVRHVFGGTLMDPKSAVASSGVGS